MRLDSFDSLDKMSEKDLLKVIVANQIQILYKISRFESKVTNSGIGDSSDVVIKDAIGNVESYNKQIDVFLKKNFAKDE